MTARDQYDERCVAPDCGATWTVHPADPEPEGPCPQCGLWPDEAAEARWLDDRTRFITGTDWPALLGIDQYRTPLQVWAHKVGQELDFETSEQLELGRIIEGGLLELGARRLPYAVERWPAFTLEEHPEHELFATTPDARLFSPGGELGRVEVKSTGRIREWEDGPPPYVQAQVQAQLACSGLEIGVIIVALHTPYGWRLGTYEVRRLDGFIEIAIERMGNWWADYVTTRRAPMPTGSVGDEKLLKAIYPGDKNLRAVALPAEMEPVVGLWNTLRDRRKALKKTEDALKNKVRAALKDAAYGATPLGRVVSWRPTKAEHGRPLRPLKHPPRGIAGPYDGAWRAPGPEEG